MDCHALFQGIFPTQGSNLCLLPLLHWQVGFYHRCQPASTVVGVMSTSKGICPNVWPTRASQDCCCWCLSLWQATDSPSSAGGPQTLTGRSGSGSCRATAPFPGSWCTQGLFVPSRVESLFCPVLWKSCNQIALAFTVRLTGDSQSFARSLGWEA